MAAATVKIATTTPTLHYLMVVPATTLVTIIMTVIAMPMIMAITIAVSVVMSTVTVMAPVLELGPPLLGGVSVPQGDAPVLQGLMVHGHADGYADLIGPGVAAADGP